MARIAAGTRVLLTRPKAASQTLATRLEAEGAHVWSEPMVVIEPVPASADTAVRATLEAPGGRAIFLSPNAVYHSQALLESLNFQARVIAMGPGTAAALSAAGVTPDLVPEAGTTSESLLQMPEFAQISGQRVVVFQGEGGRGLIQSTLGERGAIVMALVCYRRVGPNLSAREFDARWRRAQPDVIVVTSETALDNLLDVAAEHAPGVRHVDIVVISERLAGLARSRGWQGRIRMATSASDDSVVSALT